VDALAFIHANAITVFPASAGKTALTSPKFFPLRATRPFRLAQHVINAVLEQHDAVVVALFPASPSASARICCGGSAAGLSRRHH
jgi:hypothetical protein